MWYTKNGDNMEIVKWLLMIVGIFGLLIVGCMMLLRSDEKKRLNNKRYRENINMLNETNEMLDETLEELVSYNEGLKKISDYIDNFNHKFLKIK